MAITLRLSKPKLTDSIMAVFVFVLILDPSNYYLGLKSPLFFLAIVACLSTYNSIPSKVVVPVCVIYGGMLFTSMMGFLSGHTPESDTLAFFYKSFLMIFLILWSNHLRILEKVLFPALLVSGLVIFIYISMLTSPILEKAIYAYLSSAGESVPILMGRRTFIGIEIISVYHKVCVLFRLPMSIYCYKWLNEKRHKWKNFLLTFFVLLPVIAGGNRANILSGIAIIGILLLQKLWQTRLGKVISVFSVVIGTAGSLILVSMLMSDTEEPSLSAKISLFNSWYEHISRHPSILLWGQGIGTTFATEVRGEATISEWTYLELIRWFGVPIALAVVTVYLYPMYRMFKGQGKLPYRKPLTIAYIFYLLVGATNPVLLNSTGMLSLLIMYSYALNPTYRLHDKSQPIVLPEAKCCNISSSSF